MVIKIKKQERYKGGVNLLDLLLCIAAIELAILEQEQQQYKRKDYYQEILRQIV